MGVLPLPRRAARARPVPSGRPRPGLRRAAAALLAPAALAAACGPGGGGDQNPPMSRWYAAAPYLQVRGEDAPDPARVMDATGLKAFQLAFVLAPEDGGCTPTWDGTVPLASDDAIASAVAAIRDRGGDVSVSFGGADGRRLGEECSGPEATARAYQQVIDRYELEAVDIDIEGDEFENEDRTAARNELGAAKILQRDNPGLSVSVTVPGTADTGAGYWGTLLLKEARAAGFTPDDWSLMAFDGGFDGAADQIAALTAFKDVLREQYGWSEQTAYAHLGFSGMNGRTDELTGGAVEYFRQEDFADVLEFALARGLGRFTFWSVNRDRACTPVDDGTTSDTCGNVAQKAWDFTRYAVRFAEGG